MDLIEIIQKEIQQAEAGDFTDVKWNAVAIELATRIKHETAPLRASGQRNYVSIVDSLFEKFKALRPKVEEKVDEKPRFSHNHKKAV